MELHLVIVGVFVLPQETPATSEKAPLNNCIALNAEVGIFWAVLSLSAFTMFSGMCYGSTLSFLRRGLAVKTA